MSDPGTTSSDDRGVHQLTDTRIAVVGLGSMGGAMAATLQRDGWPVSGYDPSLAAQDAARGRGLAIVSTLGDLAGTPFVVLSLPSAATVADTVPELLAAPGVRVIVDTTTSGPSTTTAMVELAAERGAHFIDAPVSGGSTGAAAGTLSAFVGGSTEAVEAARPVLQSLTGGSYRVIGGAGSGNVVKLLNNVLCATNLIAVGEALDVAAAYGIDLPTAAAAVSGASGGSHVSANAFPRWVFSGTFDSGFTLGLMARDVSLALDVATERGAHPALLGATRTAWQHALQELGPRADFAEAPATATTATTALHPETIRAEGAASA